MEGRLPVQLEGGKTRAGSLLGEDASAVALQAMADETKAGAWSAYAEVSARHAGVYIRFCETNPPFVRWETGVK
jgi:hypothetical protein